MSNQKEQVKKPGGWNMAESILVFQDNVPAVGPMIEVVEAAQYLQVVSKLQTALELIHELYEEFGLTEEQLKTLSNIEGDK